jgi:hypothetical protein
MPPRRRLPSAVQVMFPLASERPGRMRRPADLTVSPKAARLPAQTGVAVIARSGNSIWLFDVKA